MGGRANKSRGGARRREILSEMGDESRHFSTAVVVMHQMIAERLGLSGGDHKYADVVLRKGPLTAGELAELTGLTTGAITGVVDRLEKAGFVRRERDPNDRRRVIIQAVRDPEREAEIGRQIHEVFEPVWRLTDNFTDEELELILRFMKGNRTAMEEIMEGMRKGGG